MSLVRELSKIIDDSKIKYEELKRSPERVAFEPLWGKTEELSTGSSGRLFRCENLRLMKELLADNRVSGKLKLIYIDPPFFSKANYDASIKAGDGALVKRRAYKDVWQEGMKEYLAMLTLRLMAMRDLLSEEGTLWVHLDWHSHHYVKILLDEIFGEENFINEIIWTYKSGGTGKKYFARKHDTILVYGKSSAYSFNLPKEKSYNRGLKPYCFKGVEEFQDEVGWYTLVNMKDVWTIDMVGRTSGERTGYATQKPETLLTRIIETATSEGDLCGDFFAGSGTLAAAAGKLGRRWLCCDMGKIAFAKTFQRLTDMDSEFTAFVEKDLEEECGELSCSLRALGGRRFSLKITGYENPELQCGDEASVGTGAGAGRKAGKSRKACKAEDGLKWLIMWGVEYSPHGEPFELLESRSKKDGKLSMEAEIEIPAESKAGWLKIKVMDGAGNISQKKIKIDTGR